MLYHSCNIFDVSFRHGVCCLMQLNLQVTAGRRRSRPIPRCLFLFALSRRICYPWKNVSAMALRSTGPQSDRLTRYPVSQTDRDGLSPVNLSDRGGDTEAIGQENRFLRRKAGRAKELVSNTQQKPKNHHVPSCVSGTQASLYKTAFLFASYRRARR